MVAHSHDRVPLWTSAIPIAAFVGLSLILTGTVYSGSAPVLVLAALFLGGSVFAAVHHAEVLALRLGEPFGSILLAVSVTIIEVALIVSILLSDAPGSSAVARDTVYAAVMIVLNGIVGLCLVVGSIRHREQSFRIDGAAATLSVLCTLAIVALVLPNYTLATRGPTYGPQQLLVVGVVSLILYMTFVFVQTVRHREYFLELSTLPEHSSVPLAQQPSNRIAAASLVLLLLSLVAVVLLAKVLSKPLDAAIVGAGLPPSFVGVVIAAIVLLPEGMAALKAAHANRLQSSVNLALGSALASIGLTIPTVAVVSLALDRPLELGLNGEHTVLLVMTLVISFLTLGTTGRTNLLQGAVHLVIFAIFLLLSAIP